MSKTLNLLLLFILCACVTEHDQNKTQRLVNEYYNALTESDIDNTKRMFYDSVRIKDGDYALTHSIDDYSNWLKWDSVFKPNYAIKTIEMFGDTAEITVSKSCKRTLYLNEGPVVTKERLILMDNKIYSLEVVAYISYNHEKWIGNREKLVNWIELNHPKLNGFIHDQSLNGGVNYVKAIELYENSY